MKSTFYPVIHDGYDGLTVFRNDLIDIEFPVDGSLIKKRFNLGIDLAPPLPFKHAGRLFHNNHDITYAIDATGDAWIEDDQCGELFNKNADSLVYLLLTADSEDVFAVMHLLSVINKEFNVEETSEEEDEI